MKILRNSGLSLLAVLFIGLLSALGQVADSEEKSVIAAFLREIYQTSTTPDSIARRYIALDEQASELSSNERYVLTAKHITILRRGERLASDSPALLNKDTFRGITISKYTDLKPSTTPLFDTDATKEQVIYVAVLKGQPCQYFLVKGGKILAFDYLKKGINGPSYFFSY
jgi:hypothetical protein